MDVGKRGRRRLGSVKRIQA